MEVPKESPDKPMEEPQKTPPTFRTTSPRPNRAKAKYSNAIMEASGLVFHGTQGKPMTTTNVKAYIKVYMNKMNMGIGLDDIGWGRGMTKEKTLDTPEGFSSFLDKLKGHLRINLGVLCCFFK